MIRCISSMPASRESEFLLRVLYAQGTVSLFENSVPSVARDLFLSFSTPPPHDLLSLSTTQQGCIQLGLHLVSLRTAERIKMPSHNIEPPASPRKATGKASKTLPSLKYPQSVSRDVFSASPVQLRWLCHCRCCSPLLLLLQTWLHFVWLSGKLPKRAAG